MFFESRPTRYDPMLGPFTRGQIVRILDLTDDIVGYWTKESLLIPQNDAAGSGRHKQFDYIELNKAAILKHLRQYGVPLDGLRWFSALVDRGRELISLSEAFPAEKIWLFAFLIRAINRFEKGEKVGIYTDVDGILTRVPARNVNEIIEDQLSRGEDDRIPEAKRIFQQSFTDFDAQAAELFPDFTYGNLHDPRSDSVALIWIEGEEWKFYHTTERSNLSGLRQPPLSAIMFHSSRILRELWSIEHYNPDE